ncbi:MAG: hypothetical protein AMS24_05070 [Chlamydiae bacterium SM23_39]|nr:MAG: hypothetical protein AMS24_05070 [Chlamydiae bacterium SM23_39]
MKQKLLLLEDVEYLGKSGDIVEVKPGYSRNFLIPQKKAIIAKKHTLALQKKLQEEREKKAKLEKKESEKIKEKIEKLTLETTVKTDPTGKMYGSIGKQDILALLEKEDIKIDKKEIILKKPIKETGTFDIKFNLKENVEATCKLNIIPEKEQKSEK